MKEKELKRFYNDEVLDKMSPEEYRNWQRDPANVRVGIGATYSIGSDSYAWEVIAVKDSKHITVRELDCKQVGDYFGNQEWELYSNEENRTENLTFRNGNWRVYEGRKLYERFSVGWACRSEDPSF